MKSLREIEAAIAQLPAESQRQLLRDLPALCPQAFPEDGWDSILADATPRPSLKVLVDKLHYEHASQPETFVLLNEDSLKRNPKPKRLKSPV